jgi:hypothetical protein
MPRSENRYRTCKNCGVSFELGVGEATHKYCSVSCRSKWHYNRWKSSGGIRDKGKIKSYWLKHEYGITKEDYDNLLAKQAYQCAICGRKEPTGYNWHVDHCHSSGKVRGLLCSKCNQGLGLFEDNVDVLYRAAEYLNENS